MFVVCQVNVLLFLFFLQIKMKHFFISKLKSLLIHSNVFLFGRLYTFGKYANQKSNYFNAFTHCLDHWAK